MNASGFAPTDEQAAIRDSVARSGRSLMISAYAGCAKTTTLVLASQGIKVPALALAFNVSIKKELERKVPANFVTKTMNGLGWQAMQRALPAVSSWKDPDGKKLAKLVTQVGKEWRFDLNSDEWETVRTLAQAAMTAGIVPGGSNWELLPDEPEAWASVAEDAGLLQEDFARFHELAREVLRRNNELTLQGIASFDDQVYFPTVISGKWPLFPVMVVDEAQDLSPLNHAMLRRAMRPDGRLIVCGDPKQAIYGFRGADTASMEKIRALRGDWSDLPLTLTFRCSKLVVGRQQSHVPGFRAHESNLDGEFRTLGQAASPGEASPGWTWNELSRAVPAGQTLAVLCRNNAPLLALAFKLIRQRVAPVMLGRDIGKGLIALSRKIFPDDGLGRDAMLGQLADWELSERSALLATGKEEKLDALADKVGCLQSVIGYAEVVDASGLRQALAALFAKESGQVTLGSIHRSKGLEWDAVLHLDPWRLPSAFAKKAAKLGDFRALEQEMNLQYVCETRTRNLLMEANVKEFV